MPTPIPSPVIVEPRVTDEKILELLGHQSEWPELDFKRMLDLSETPGRVELAKDIGAFQVLGGYVIAGADNNGKLTGQLDPAQEKWIDEAQLTPMMLKWLPEPLELRTRVTEIDGKPVAIIYIAPHPAGCAFFRADGQYGPSKSRTVVFRKGDVFWRNGTRSEPMGQLGFETLVARRVAEALQERAERRVERGPLAEFTLAAEADTLPEAALGLVQRKDDIPLRKLLNDATARARELLVEHPDDFEAELGVILDKLACVAATYLQYEQEEWFEKVVDGLARIYDLGLDEQGLSLTYQTRIDPGHFAPRLWLLLIRRVYGLGAMAVRLGNWKAVRTLTLNRPEHLDEYEKSWLRHALTMASRADQFRQREEEVGLLQLALQDVMRLDCLRADVGQDEDAILTSLARFDVLYSITSIGNARSVESAAFYPNFARFRTDRIEPVVERLLKDDEMRQTLFPLEDDDLAIALNEINKRAQNEGFRYAGFWGFDRSAIEDFIKENLPKGQDGTVQ